MAVAEQIGLDPRFVVVRRVDRSRRTVEERHAIAA